MKILQKLSASTLLAFIILSACSQQNEIVKYLRFEHQGAAHYGIIENDEIQLIEGDLYGEWTKTNKTLSLDEVKILAPSEPSKVIAMAYNYASHTVDRPKPDHPLGFAKLPTCIIAHEEDIIMPDQASNLHYEGELAVIFNKKTENVSTADVQDHILGVTIGNDVTERNWQKEDSQWLRGKASDTFGPLGPWVVSGLDYNNLLLETRLNGETVQSQPTSDMFFNLEECVSYLSYYITFYPGDVLFLGTPGITKQMNPGDVVEVEIEHIGILRNKVRQE